MVSMVRFLMFLIAGLVVLMRVVTSEGRRRARVIPPKLGWM